MTQASQPSRGGLKERPDSEGLWIRYERQRLEWASIVREVGRHGLLVAECWCLNPHYRPTLGALHVCIDEFDKGGWSKVSPPAPAAVKDAPQSFDATIERGLSGVDLPVMLSEAEVASILCQCDGDKIVLHVAAPERTKPWDDTPIEYAVVSIRPERNCPQNMMVFGKYDTYGWLANPSLRGLVNVLMRNVALLPASSAQGEMERLTKELQRERGNEFGKTWKQLYDEAVSDDMDDAQQQIATATATIAALRKRVEEAEAILETIVCTEGCDAGLVILSDDSPTHYDAEQKCQVFDHENFSPLGDALIALHKALSAQGDKSNVCETCNGLGEVDAPGITKDNCPKCDGTGVNYDE